MRNFVENLLVHFKFKGTEDHPKVGFVFDESLGYDFSAAFARYYHGHWSRDNAVIPLFIVVDRAVGARGGFSVPDEFVLSVFDLHTLPARVKQLSRMHPDGISEDDLCAFCVGAFRRFLGLGDDNHGRGELDLTELLSGEGCVMTSEACHRWIDGKKGWAAIYRDRLGANNLDPVATMYRGLFRKEVQELQSRMEELDQCIRRLATELGFFE